MLKNMDKKKLFIIAGAIVGAIVLIIIILLIFHAMHPTKKSYAAIENDLLKAAQKYYGDNENLLPQNANEQITIDDATLTSLDYLDNLNDMAEEGVTCSGKVVVSYVNGKYRYTPILDCGEVYKTETLYSHIENNVTRVFNESGLYDLNGEYVYRGEKPNNYLEFSGKMYRIVKLTNGKVVIIYDEKLDSYPWDDRFNDVRNGTDGYNEYKISRIKEVLEELYNSDEIVSESDKQLVSNQTVYVGKRSESDNYNDGSIEKSDYLENQYFGLLPLYDYINASIDPKCNSVITDNCVNYNYLNYYHRSWWTSTADNSNNYKVYRISPSGKIEKSTAAIYGNVRPIVYLVSDAIYVSGDGTYENPYKIK